MNAPAGQESDLTKEKAEAGSAKDKHDGAGRRTETGFRLQGILLWVVLALILIEWWVYTNGI